MAVRIMRHAEPDWALVKDEVWRGAANDLAPLTSTGERQARAAAESFRSSPPSLILSSPMTRALQTAAIVAGALAVELQVHMDLREWLPDKSYRWTSADEVAAAYHEMRASHGARPNDFHRWEPLASVRTRANQAIEKYAAWPGDVLVVSHEVLIYALTGEEQTEHCQVRSLHAR